MDLLRPAAFAAMYALVVAAGCSSPSPMGGSGPDASVDAGRVEQGLGLSFISRTGLPSTFQVGEGEKEATVTISTIALRLRDLRIIGDSATGDTSNTRKDLVDLDWSRAASLAVSFPDAPPGLYSRIRGTVLQIELGGTVEFQVDGSTQKFELEIEKENTSVAFEIEFSRRVEVGAALELALALDLEQLTREIPFTEIEPEDGEIEVDGDPMKSVLSALEHSFELIQ